MTKDDPKNLGQIWVWLAGALGMASHTSQKRIFLSSQNFI
jgi:hypothetical protein